MSRQAEIFAASARARREISRSAYIRFGIGAALVIIGAAVASVAFAASGAPRTPVLALAGGLACAGLAGLLTGLVTLAALQQPIQVEVTPHRLVWREGRRIATLEYDEVVRVELVKAAKRERNGLLMEYPVVRFIENDGEMMEFEVTFEDRGMVHHARFDARAVTRAVLPYLPSHAVIAPAVTEFVQTGEVDIDLLPGR